MSTNKDRGNVEFVRLDINREVANNPEYRNGVRIRVVTNLTHH